MNPDKKKRLLDGVQDCLRGMDTKTIFSYRAFGGPHPSVNTDYMDGLLVGIHANRFANVLTSKIEKTIRITKDDRTMTKNFNSDLIVLTPSELECLIDFICQENEKLK